MKKALLFWRLYFHALLQVLLRGKPLAPEGIPGVKVFRFFDPQYPEQGQHGVVAFVLPYGTKPSDFVADLYGPFGYTSQIDLAGRHLYGRDTWGSVNPDQIKANPVLEKLIRQYPTNIILLAGVRKFFIWHLPPLNNPRGFILGYKDYIKVALH